MPDKFNGWSNKETWLVNLWLGDWLQMDVEDGNTIDAEYIETMVEEMAEDVINENGLFRDLLNCALGSIDYHELASHYESEND